MMWILDDFSTSLLVDVDNVVQVVMDNASNNMGAKERKISNDILDIMCNSHPQFDGRSNW
jgi:hypothetical protein